jgi:ParB family chromosome partitioning protein
VRGSACCQPIVVASARTAATSSSWASAGLRAARRPGWTTCRPIVRDTTDDALLRDALLENIHRVQLNPLEEAAAYQQLLEEFGATHEELASQIGAAARRSPTRSAAEAAR